MKYLAAFFLIVNGRMHFTQIVWPLNCVQHEIGNGLEAAPR